MTIADLRKQPHLSVSSINMYLECGLRYKFSKILKEKPEYISDNLIFGTVIHLALADYHQSLLTGEELTTVELQERFEKYWTEADKENIRYTKGKNDQILLQDGKELLKRYLAVEKDNFNIVAIEEPFELMVEGLEIPLIGVMDLVEEDDNGTVIITEHKTSKRSYTDNQVNNLFQLSVYYLAAKSNGYKDREVLLKINCLIKTKIPKVETYYSCRSESDVNRAIKRIQGVYEGIQKGVFIANDGGWKCSYCEFKRSCCEFLEN